ncbi:hypothetical protein [Breoghania sp.]|uniref:hypothetical protein n=1 Tax=Breoghania sp. TaxID=2065378 RepID=UPI00263980D7|nr:hypothetical protein [Breoghania sp.]MDJ0930247.1 hypothetical protein [Breoghania sp.]
MSFGDDENFNSNVERIVKERLDPCERTVLETYYIIDKFVIYEADDAITFDEKQEESESNKSLYGALEWIWRGIVDSPSAEPAHPRSQVRYYINGDYDVGKEFRQKTFCSLARLCNDVNTLAVGKVWAGRELARAFLFVFEKEPVEKPVSFLLETQNRLEAQIKSRLRKQYVFSNLFAFIGLSIVLCLIYAYGSFYGVPVDVSRYVSYTLFGGTGALLSVSVGTRKIDPDIDLRRWEHRFTGMARIMIGAIGAIAVSVGRRFRLDRNLERGDRRDLDAAAHRVHRRVQRISCAQPDGARRRQAGG